MKSLPNLKALLCLALWAISFTAFAQSYEAEETQTGDIFTELEQAIAPLDFSDITSHHFVDKGMDIYDWKLFDGQLLPDTQALRTGDWGWMYVQALSSQLPVARHAAHVIYDRLPPADKPVE